MQRDTRAYARMYDSVRKHPYRPWQGAGSTLRQRASQCGLGAKHALRYCDGGELYCN